MKWQLTLAGFIGLVAASVLGGVAFHFLESPNEANVAQIVKAKILDLLGIDVLVSSVLFGLSFKLYGKLKSRLHSRSLTCLPCFNNNRTSSFAVYRRMSLI
jgi:multisubunit Na+/H+ antiporter MnhB subunit